MATVSRLGLIATLLAPALWGCSYSQKGHPSYCRSDADCNKGYECSKEHYCLLISACQSNTDCEKGFECKNQGCVKKPECTDGKKESCYEGAAGTEGKGECRAGERVCAGGFFTDCLGQRVDAKEDCDGLDNDCDGKTDELDQAECDSGLLGACAKGELACSGAFAVCRATVEKQAEVCNALDDDCDGSTDEGTSSSCYPEGQKGCEKSNGDFWCRGICAPGAKNCVGGTLDACEQSITPQKEQCTGSSQQLPQDEDCDGQVDENCPCDPTQDLPRDCYGGPLGTQGIGECQTGTQTCDSQSKLWGECQGQTLPEPETCLNMHADNDCDGKTDDIAGLGDFCADDNHQGICREGTLQCQPGAVSKLFCLTIEPGRQPEVCDRLDNDCDGSTDEDFDLGSDENNCGACGRKCGAGQSCCRGSCVNLNSDPNFCGSCDNACGAGLSCCSGKCVNLGSDEGNCGGCGTECNPEQSCCGSCTNTQVDTANCGSCGHGCAQSQYCCAGQCSSDTCSCVECEQSGGTCCGELCVDVMSDSSNCGSCGHACSNNTECMDGICCAAGELNCGGACVNPRRDEDNCGGCGAACDPALTCCDTCVNTKESPLHCGACDSPCATPNTCSSGLCCPQGTSNCNGQCVDLSSDERYCGSCTNACSKTQTCCSGSCVDTQTDNNNCGQCKKTCQVSVNTPEYCCQGICVPVWLSGSGGGITMPPVGWCQCAEICGKGTVCCYKECVNLQNNVSNCGACGNVCRGIAPCCVNGVCSALVCPNG